MAAAKRFHFIKEIPKIYKGKYATYFWFYLFCLVVKLFQVYLVLPHKSFIPAQKKHYYHYKPEVFTPSIKRPMKFYYLIPKHIISFLPKTRKVSIELLRYAVLWKLLWRVRKVSIKLLRSVVFKLGPKSVHRTAEVRSSRGPPYRGEPKSVHKTAKVRSSMGKNVEGPKSVHRTAEVRSYRACP